MNNNYNSVVQCAYQHKMKRFTKRKRDDSQYFNWRKMCLERDKYLCILCSSNEELEVHHIIRWVDNPLYRFKKFNGATLCNQCHKKYHNGKGLIFPKEIVIIIIQKLKDNGQKFRGI